MRSPEDLVQLFRERGLRVTPQREYLFRLLSDNDRHPTVEELYDAARHHMPTISLKTVYQTVHELAEIGEVQVIHLAAGSLRVDPDTDMGHQHLVCTACGTVRDLFRAEGLAIDLPEEYDQGFLVGSAEVIFRGLCPACRERLGRSAS